MTSPVFRELSGVAEFTEAEALQKTVWGKDDKADPYDLMMVIQNEGGLAAGAFVGSELVGYVFGFPTRLPHIQHSHRLAVLPKMRKMGLGLRLKWFQRDWCLAKGITHVRWTFDPLRAANAGLNIGRLGTVVDTYLPDYYGKMKGINAGTSSDRLLANWYLDTDHVANRAAGVPQELPENARRIPIPTDFAALLKNDPAKALDERLRVRAKIGAALDHGLLITGFISEDPAYLMTKADAFER